MALIDSLDWSLDYDLLESMKLKNKIKYKVKSLGNSELIVNALNSG